MIIKNYQIKFFSNKVILLFSLLLIFTFYTNVSAETFTGNITGTFQGEISYDEPVIIEESLITGAWSLDTVQNDFTIYGHFASSGLSGEFKGEYDWNKQIIIGYWKTIDNKDWIAFTLSLIGDSPILLSGDISGNTAGPTGKVPFSIKLSVNVLLQEKWFTLNNKMNGTWAGTATGTWDAVIDTFLGEQHLSGEFSEPVNGIWNGNWEVAINDTGELGGTFNGVFSGIADVTVDTPIGNIDVDLPVNGVHEGGILLGNSGSIEFQGVWYELLETHGTSGTVTPDSINSGYGGQLDLLLTITESGLFVDGNAQGGGKYTETQAFQGAIITVSYKFNGNFQGVLDYPK